VSLPMHRHAKSRRLTDRGLPNRQVPASGT
jgi:hypothetical protein